MNIITKLLDILGGHLVLKDSSDDGYGIEEGDDGDDDDNEGTKPRSSSRTSSRSSTSFSSSGIASTDTAVLIPFDPLASLAGAPALSMIILNPTPPTPDPLLPNEHHNQHHPLTEHKHQPTSNNPIHTSINTSDNSNEKDQLDNPNDQDQDVDDVTDQDRDRDRKGDKLLLIVDDCPVSLKLLPKVLQSRAYIIDTARDGLEMIQKILPDPIFGITGPIYDVIIVDYAMPRMTGAEAVKYLREHDYKGVIVGLTAYTMDDDLQAFKDSGCDLVLQKPFDVAKFDAFVPMASNPH